MICLCKCPGCGDEMHYDMDKHILVCDTCRTEIDASVYDYSYVALGECETENDGIYESTCPSCGTAVYVVNTDVHTTCAHCGSKLTMYGLTKDEILPEKIIPFVLTKEMARTKLAGWWSQHPTLPRYDEAKLNISLSATYVPVWLYDTDAFTSIEAEVATDESDASQITSSSYIVKIHKGVKTSYRKVPFDGSAIIREDHFHGIEPYDYSELKDFNSSFLAGVSAERYYYSGEDLMPRIVTRMRKAGIEECKTSLETDKYGGPIKDYKVIQAYVIPKHVIYAFVPVWVCSYVYKGKRHLVYVNGQSGKVDGTIFLSGTRLIKEVSLFSGCSLLCTSSFFIAALQLIEYLGASKISELEAGMIRPFNILASGFFIPIFLVIFYFVWNTRGKKEAYNIYVNEKVQERQGKKNDIRSSYILRLAPGLLFLLLALFFSMSNGTSDNIAMIFTIFPVMFSLIVSTVDIIGFSKKRIVYYTHSDIVEEEHYMHIYDSYETERWIM